MINRMTVAFGLEIWPAQGRLSRISSIACRYADFDRHRIRICAGTTLGVSVRSSRHIPSGGTTTGVKRTGNPTLAVPLLANRLCHASTSITMFMRDHLVPELGQGRKMATYGKLVSYPKRYTNATGLISVDVKPLQLLIFYVTKRPHQPPWVASRGAKTARGLTRVIRAVRRSFVGFSNSHRGLKVSAARSRWTPSMGLWPSMSAIVRSSNRHSRKRWSDLCLDRDEPAQNRPGHHIA